MLKSLQAAKEMQVSRLRCAAVEMTELWDGFEGTERAEDFSSALQVFKQTAFRAGQRLAMAAAAATTVRSATTAAACVATAAAGGGVVWCAGR
jgi:hypothetical protein